MAIRCAFCGGVMVKDNIGWYCDNPDCSNKYVDQEVSTTKQTKLGEEEN